MLRICFSLHNSQFLHFRRIGDTRNCLCLTSKKRKKKIIKRIRKRKKGMTIKHIIMKEKREKQRIIMKQKKHKKAEIYS